MTNTARFGARPLRDGGTPIHVWRSAQQDLPVLDLTKCPEIVVVGAHPDDETLGFGAAAATLAGIGAHVRVVSASDGGASHGPLPPQERARLERVRRAELCCALDALGLPEPISLGLPDGRLAEVEERLTDLLTDILSARPSGTWCAATWRGDGHPDHEAVGRAAALAAERSGSKLLEYPVWMWHWAHPGDDAVPWQRAQRVSPTPDGYARKQAAAQLFQSQLEDRGQGAGPVLPPEVVHRLLEVDEVVFR